jgi:hypothetical protein
MFTNMGNENIIFPADSGVINVKSPPYNAKGDGVTDDTAALQRVLDDNVSQRKIIYLPNSTYLVSNTLRWKPGKRLMLQGQSQAKTVIRLKDQTLGFTDPTQHKPVILVFGGEKTAQAFYNFIANLSIDVGRSNPGAVGINFINNNIGGIRDVTIRSSDPQRLGARGLLLTRPFPGPGLIKNLTIEGFDQGVRVSSPDYSMVFENLTLRHQRQAGLVNQDNVLAIHQLSSENSVPALLNMPGNGKWGMITLIAGRLLGGNPTQPAIDNGSGEVYLRDVQTRGYRSVLSDAGKMYPATTIAEYTSHPIVTLFTNSSKRLPIVAAPEVSWPPLNDWVSVTRYGARPNDAEDDSDAIQAAIDAGKSTVYFPQGSYRISKTILVRGHVSRVIGMWSIIDIQEPLKSADRPVWRVEKNRVPVVVIERFQSSYFSGVTKFTAIEHASPSQLVIRNSGLGGQAYRNQKGAGSLFIEDVSGAPWIFNHQQVWARQLNPEFVGTKIINRGSNLWILGLKTEETGTVVTTESRGTTEIWGGLLYPIDKVPPDQPAFVTQQSTLRVSIAETAYSPDARYRTLIQATKGNLTRTLQDHPFPRRTTHGRLVPLMSTA